MTPSVYLCCLHHPPYFHCGHNELDEKKSLEFQEASLFVIAVKKQTLHHVFGITIIIYELSSSLLPVDL